MLIPDALEESVRIPAKGRLYWTCPKESFFLTLGIITWHMSQNMKIIYLTILVLSKITINVLSHMNMQSSM